MTDITIYPPVNSANAVKTGVEIEELLSQISNHEMKLARSYARLGGLLREVKNNQYWGEYGFDRFSSYLESVRKKIGRERSQVYAILSVAESLLPLVSEDQLENIGITKAQELRRFVNQGGNINTEICNPNDQLDDAFGTVRLIDYASDPKVTASILRVKLNEVLHVHEGPKGTWYDMGGFYADNDERKELEQFWNLGRGLFSSHDEQADHVWRREVIMAAIRECISTWITELTEDSDDF